MEIDNIHTPEWVGELCDKAMIVGFCLGSCITGIVAVSGYFIFALPGL